MRGIAGDINEGRRRTKDDGMELGNGIQVRWGMEPSSGDEQETLEGELDRGHFVRTELGQ